MDIKIIDVKFGKGFTQLHGISQTTTVPFVLGMKRACNYKIKKQINSKNIVRQDLLQI